MLFQPSLLLFGGIRGVEGSPKGAPPSPAGACRGASQRERGAGGAPCVQPPRAGSGTAASPGRGFSCALRLQNHLFRPALRRWFVSGSRCQPRGLGAPSWGDGLGARDLGGREGSALMSHAGARGAGNGNFWAALFIPRSGYKPSSPSPLSGGKFKPQLVSLGLAGVAAGDGAVLAAGWPGHRVPLSSWAGWLCPPRPEPPWWGARPVSAEGSWDGSSQLPPGMCGGLPVLGGRGGGRGLRGGTGSVWRVAGRDTRSPSDAQTCRSLTALLIS